MSATDIERLQQEHERWEKEIVALVTARWPEREGPFKNTSGVEIKRLYTPADVQRLDYLDDLGFPGSYPFARGVHPTGYRGRYWTRRQVAGYHTAVETNQRLRYLTEHGQTGLNVVFDMPTHFGLDSDDPRATGEVGKEGVAIDTLRDMEDLFEGIDLGQVSASLITGGTVLFSMYLALADKRGVPYENLRGTLQNDMLLFMHSCNIFVTPIEGMLRLLDDVVEFCVKRVPKWWPLNIAGYNNREAGASAVQEIGFSLASAIAYIESFLKRGLQIDDIAPRISFFLSAHNDFFEEIAKYRAMRRMWAKLMKERFGAESPFSMALRFHTQTAGSTLTAEQPYNNIVRTTIQALAAVLGGTNSLHTNSFDEAYSLPTEEAAQIALRTQQIIAEESGVTNTIDPLGGSYFVEALTNELEKRAWDLIEEIDRRGGMVKACKDGWVHRQKNDFVRTYFNSIRSGERAVVGVNKYRTDQRQKIPVFELDPAYEKKQVDRLNETRRSRDNSKVGVALERLRDALAGGENSMEATIEAVKAYASIGEIANVHKQVFGVQREPEVNFAMFR
ncbi:MAG: methylmalonyl-CoA mutase [Candidatus Abyssobacteria bacterium SURF_17]|uniref:Methylmalonyl-CoA mutase n=1 Tax=Candidatus Abyssobacteria bacterium SURF_17 TaxID=2093361 RepID=A0A419EWZ6_9BACT|nr:MAG: methylmalonyl-CoA mutase [Candidatus Abyssubacteria bacterium SURF_17]